MHSSTFNTRSNDFTHRHIECMTLCKHEILSHTSVRNEGGTAGERKLVGVPKFLFWGKCAMLLTNVQSHWMTSTSPGRCINLYITLQFSAMWVKALLVGFKVRGFCRKFT